MVNNLADAKVVINEQSKAIELLRDKISQLGERSHSAESDDFGPINLNNVEPDPLPSGTQQTQPQIASTCVSCLKMVFCSKSIEYQSGACKQLRAGA